MKNGLVFENGELFYYKDGKPKHAGVIKVDGAIYYISANGKAVKGKHVVHSDMSHGILKRGTYTFGEDYKLVEGSYIAPKKRKSNRKKKLFALKNYQFISVRDTVKAIWKNKKNRAAIAVTLVFAAFMLTVPGMIHPTEAPSEPNSTEPADLGFKITLPVFEGDVLLCSKAAKMEYDGTMALVDAVKTGDPYRPFYFEYHLSVASGTLYLSEKEDLSDAKTYPMPEDSDFVEIHNLKVDTTYYYKVTVNGHAYPGTFHTALSPRFIYIPGLVNTRDIGGYKTLDGKTVKQGLLIRGVEIDGLENHAYFIPESEIENVQDSFGFVYDLDLRSPALYSGAYSSRLGIPHKFYNSPMYGDIFHLANRGILHDIFSDMADPDKYPMYLHCTWGKDRTGTIIFLLQGILNMSEEDMKNEYLLSSYCHTVLAESTNMDVIINGLAPYDGETLQEKIVSFMITELGITEAEIASMRSIFLED